MKTTSHVSKIVALLLGLTAAATMCCAQTYAKGFRLKSPVIRNNGGNLPLEFTCDGEAASLPFTWSDPPEGTKSLAITMHHIPPDDEEKHVYIVLYNIPPTVRAIPKNSKDIGIWGQNSMRRTTGYTPPCSRGGGIKIYTATLYALSVDSFDFKDTPKGMVTMDQLLDAARGKILATSTLDIVYSRGDKAPGGPPRPADGSTLPPPRQ